MKKNIAKVAGLKSTVKLGMFKPVAMFMALVVLPISLLWLVFPSAKKADEKVAVATKSQFDIKSFTPKIAPHQKAPRMAVSNVASIPAINTQPVKAEVVVKGVPSTPVAPINSYHPAAKTFTSPMEVTFFGFVPKSKIRKADSASSYNGGLPGYDDGKQPDPNYSNQPPNWGGGSPPQKEKASNWSDIAMSEDGQYQTATARDGYVNISQDYGVNWTPVETKRAWLSTAVSADGQFQSATVADGSIYVSADYGKTWISRMMDSSRYWSDIAMSATGQYQSVTATGDCLYISDNYGTTWTPKVTDATRDWVGIAMSATGQYQTATEYLGSIYLTNDFGTTWYQLGSGMKWSSVAVSATGQYQTATVSQKYIYASNDFGVTWSEKNVDGYRSWSSAAVSADGRCQTATVFGGKIYISWNNGVNWTPINNSRAWTSVTMSVDGKYQSATASDGVFTSFDYGVNWTPRVTDSGQ